MSLVTGAIWGLAFMGIGGLGLAAWAIWSIRHEARQRTVDKENAKRREAERFQRLFGA